MQLSSADCRINHFERQHTKCTGLINNILKYADSAKGTPDKIFISNDIVEKLSNLRGEMGGQCECNKNIYDCMNEDHRRGFSNKVEEALKGGASAYRNLDIDLLGTLVGGKGPPRADKLHEELLTLWHLCETVGADKITGVDFARGRFCTTVSTYSESDIDINGTQHPTEDDFAIIGLSKTNNVKLKPEQGDIWFAVYANNQGLPSEATLIGLSHWPPDDGQASEKVLSFMSYYHALWTKSQQAEQQGQEADSA